MPTPPPRKSFRFQFHLSTAIVMMFVAGWLIWTNLTGEHAGHLDRSRCYEFGWPFRAFTECRDYVPPHDGELRYSDVSAMGICGNIIVALTVLGFVWFLCEWLIRHRAAQKGA